MARLVQDAFVRGKRRDQSLCEDALFVGDRFAAVIDGVTAKGQLSYSGKTSGRYAAEVLVTAFAQLDGTEGTEHHSQPLDVLRHLDRALAQAMADAAQKDGVTIRTEDYLRASVIYYDYACQTVVAYGDCLCRIGDQVFTHAKRIDEKLSAKRARVLEGCLATGMSVDQLRDNDLGRAAILDDLHRQFAFENTPGPYGYPVLNGQGICPDMLVTHPVASGQPVILCSDGYPVVCATRAQSERERQCILARDPLLMRAYPSTKGWDPAHESYDDRAWLQLTGD